MAASLLNIALRAGAKTKPWQLSTNPLLSAPFDFTKSILRDKWAVRNIVGGDVKSNLMNPDTKVVVDYIKESFPLITRADKPSGLAGGLDKLIGKYGSKMDPNDPAFLDAIKMNAQDPSFSFLDMAWGRGAGRLNSKMVIGMARDAVKLKRLQIQLKKAKKGSKKYNEIVSKMDKIVGKEWHPRLRSGGKELASLPKVEAELAGKKLQKLLNTPSDVIKERARVKMATPLEEKLASGQIKKSDLTVKDFIDNYDVRQNRSTLALFQNTDDIQKIRFPKRLRDKWKKYSGGAHKGQRYVSNEQVSSRMPSSSGDYIVTRPGRYRVRDTVGERLRQAELSAQPISPERAAELYKLDAKTTLQYRNFLKKVKNKNPKDGNLADFDDFEEMLIDAHGEWGMVEPDEAAEFLKRIEPSPKQFHKMTGLLQFLKQIGLNLPK